MNTLKNLLMVSLLLGTTNAVENDLNENNINNGNNINIGQQNQYPLLTKYELQDLDYFRDFYNRFKNMFNIVDVENSNNKMNINDSLVKLADALSMSQSFTENVLESNNTSFFPMGMDNRPVLTKLSKSTQEMVLIVEIMGKQKQFGIILSLHQFLYQMKSMVTTYNNCSSNDNSKLVDKIKSFLSNYFWLIQHIDKFFSLKQELKNEFGCKLAKYDEIYRQGNFDEESVQIFHHKNGCTSSQNCLNSYAYNKIIDDFLLSFKQIGYYIEQVYDYIK